MLLVYSSRRVWHRIATVVDYSMRKSIHAIHCDFLCLQGAQSERLGQSQPRRAFLIGERERANLVVAINGPFIVHTSCKCACAALYALSHTRCLAICADRSRELSSIRRHALQPSVTDRGCIYLFKILMVTRCNLQIRYCCMPAAWWTTTDEVPFCSPAHRSANVQYACNAERRQVDLSCVTKGKLCADGTRNIAGTSKVGSLPLANNVQHFHFFCLVFVLLLLFSASLSFPRKTLMGWGAQFGPRPCRFQRSDFSKIALLFFRLA